MYEVDGTTFDNRGALLAKWRVILDTYDYDAPLSDDDKTLVLEMASYRYTYKEFIDAGVTEVKPQHHRNNKALAMFNSEGTRVMLLPETIIRRVKTIEQIEQAAGRPPRPPRP